MIINNLIVKETFYYSISKAIPGIFGFCSIILFMRIFGSKEYGQYSFLLAQCNLVAAISFGWLNQAQLRYYSNDNILENYNEGQLKFLFFSVIISALILFPLVLIQKSSLEIWLISFLAVFSIGIFNYLKTRYQSKLLPRKIIILNTLQSFLAILLPIVLFIITKNHKSLIFGIIISFVLGIIFSIINDRDYKFRKIKFVRLQKNKKLFNKWINYGLPLSIWFGAGIALSFLDRFFINYYLPKEALGMYSSLHELLVKSFSLTLFPFTMALHPRIINLWNQSNKKQSVKLIIKGLNVMLCIGTILSFLFWKLNNFIFVGIQLAMPEFTSEYKKLIIPLFLTGFLWQLSFLTHKMLELKEQTFLMVLSIIPSVVINITINYIYLPKLGLIVTAYAAFFSALTYCLITTIHFFINSRKINKL